MPEEKKMRRPVNDRGQMTVKDLALCKLLSDISKEYSKIFVYGAASVDDFSEFEIQELLRHEFALLDDPLFFINMKFRTITMIRYSAYKLWILLEDLLKEFVPSVLGSLNLPADTIDKDQVTGKFFEQLVVRKKKFRCYIPKTALLPPEFERNYLNMLLVFGKGYYEGVHITDFFIRYYKKDYIASAVKLNSEQLRESMEVATYSVYPNLSERAFILGLP